MKFKINFIGIGRKKYTGEFIQEFSNIDERDEWLLSEVMKHLLSTNVYLDETSEKGIWDVSAGFHTVGKVKLQEISQMTNIKEEERRKSIIEFIESNKTKRTKIAFLFDDKKTGEKDIKIYLGEMLKVFEEETKQKMIKEFKEFLKRECFKDCINEECQKEVLERLDEELKSQVEKGEKLCQ